MSSVTASASPDPFDPSELAKLRLSQDFAELAQVKQVLATIACKTPPKQDFVRVRPGAENRFPTAIFKDEVTGEHYMVSPEYGLELGARPTLLVVAMSRSTPVPFLWPLTIPGANGSVPNSWHVSAMEYATQAETVWTKVKSDKAANCYVGEVPRGDIPEPDWSNVPGMAELLRLAFKERFINSAQHPVVKRLRGEL